MVKMSQKQKTAKETFTGSGLSLDLPEIKVKINDIAGGINLLNFLSNNKILSSKSEAQDVR